MNPCWRSYELLRYPKIANFQLTEAGLTSNWGRISPAVHWCYQNKSNYIYGAVRRQAMSLFRTFVFVYVGWSDNWSGIALYGGGLYNLKTLLYNIRRRKFSHTPWVVSFKAFMVKIICFLLFKSFLDFNHCLI